MRLKMVITILSGVAAFISWMNRRKLLSIGERMAIARHLAAIAERAGVARRIEDEVAIMSDEEILREAELEGWING